MSSVVPEYSMKHFHYLPCDWKLKKLEQVVYQKITYGIVQPGVFDCNGVPLIRGVDYMSGWKKSDSFFMVSKELHHKFKRSTTRKGDVLLSIAGYAGHVSVVPEWLEEANITQTTARISVEVNEASPHFVAYFLDSIEGKLQSRRYIKGSAQEGLNLDDVQKFLIPIPPLPEQKKIASILTSVDEVIENTQKQIDKLQDLKKATMNELLTKGIGHTEFKDSELGRIPKSWEVAQIGDVTSFSQGIQVDVEQHHETKDDSKVRFVRISDYTKLDETPRYIDSALALKGLVEKDDVVMIRYGEAGRVCRGIVGAIANNLFTIRPSPRLLKDYLYHYCASEEIRSKVEALSASSAMPAVSFSSLRTLKLKIPPVDEQDLIVSAISSLGRSIEIHSQKLSQTQSLKKSLIQDLLTGKVRVTVN